MDTYNHLDVNMIALRSVERQEIHLANQLQLSAIPKQLLRFLYHSFATSERTAAQTTTSNDQIICRRVDVSLNSSPTSFHVTIKNHSVDAVETTREAKCESLKADAWVFNVIELLHSTQEVRPFTKVSMLFLGKA